MQHITYQELKEWKTADKSFQLIDVREHDEHEAYNIGGELIPLELILKKPELLDFSKPIVIYCKRGIRSQLAIQRLAIRFPQSRILQFISRDSATFHSLISLFSVINFSVTKIDFSF